MLNIISVYVIQLKNVVICGHAFFFQGSSCVFSRTIIIYSFYDSTSGKSNVRKVKTLHQFGFRHRCFESVC